MTHEFRMAVRNHWLMWADAVKMAGIVFPAGNTWSEVKKWTCRNCRFIKDSVILYGPNDPWFSEKPDESLKIPDVLLIFVSNTDFHGMTDWIQRSGIQHPNPGPSKGGSKKLKHQIIRKLRTRTNLGQMWPPCQCPPNTDNRKFHLWTSKGILHHAGILDQQVFKVLGVEVHLLR